MLIMCTILAFGIIFTACSKCSKEKISAVKANDEDKLKLKYINTLRTDYSKDIIEYRDSETGVHFVYSAGNAGGICPRYNDEDGTLYTD